MRKLLIVWLIACVPSVVYATSASRAVPEAFTGLSYQKAAYAKKAMVSAANPHAAQAGVDMLQKGGSAVDAAIAVQLVLTLVEPQSSGIGGGAFLMWYDAESRTIESFDGRETAPMAATPELFLNDDGKPVSWLEAVVGGRSVGVPGLLKMMWDAHNKHGKLAWADLFVPAIELAEQGFIVSPRLAKLVAMKFNPGLMQLTKAKNYFYPNGQPLQEGSLKKNSILAETLKRIAKRGVDEFYRGTTAEKIVSAVQHAEKSPGQLTMADMGQYQPKIRPPVCMDYAGEAGDFKVCSMGPPSSGGLTVLQILKLLEPYDVTAQSFNSLETIHLYTQAAKLAFADRNKYIADSDFVDVPVRGFLNEDYVNARRAKISMTKDMGVAVAGEIGTEQLAENSSIAQPNTSHFSIVDQFGNLLSMTSSIEMAFGSTVMVEGFLLNNHLTDFSLTPKRDGKWVANRVEAGKRPRSSMTPVIVFKNDEPYAVLGSPGGSRIINYVGYALVGLLDYGLDMESVVNLPRVSNRNGATTLEAGTEIAKLKSALEAKGHKVRVASMASGIHGILKTEAGWQGAADPRREGSAIGF